MFKFCDVDGNGVLCEEEFRQLLKMLNESVVIFADPQAEASRLLEIIDPQNNQKITYSECVQLLSTETVVSLGDYLERKTPII